MPTDSSPANCDNTHSLVANLVDLHTATTRAAKITVTDGVITAIDDLAADAAAPTTFLLPGFVDAHIHVESSMLTPNEFARAAVVHGTVATVSDPHEIANVLGREGVDFMLQSAAKVPLKIQFGVPSCVPATEFETAGAALDAAAVAELLDDPRLSYLAEMMNFPGVLAGDPEVMSKIAAADARNKPVDGHAPGLRGDDAAAYVAAGISTDHECTTKEEALDKLAAGCKIQIREGSAARNFDALFTLIDEHPTRVMFCSDDKHPDQLLVGHINLLVREAIDRGQNMMNVLRCACVNPIEHYGLAVGLLRVGDAADFIEVADLAKFKVLRTFIDGVVVAENGIATFDTVAESPINHFVATPNSIDDFRVPAPAAATNIRVIEAIDGELITTVGEYAAKIVDGNVESDIDRDLLKIAVINRHTNVAEAKPAVAFIKNIGLKRGAIASSVAHDCHNIVAVGATDESLCQAVNAIVEAKGGLVAVADGESHVLPLPVAGLMSTESCADVAATYDQLNAVARDLGTTLGAPFMTLSFMALLVIPSLKLSDRGLFDGSTFEFTSLFLNDGN